MRSEKKHSIVDFLGMGTIIGLGAAIGIILGLAMEQVILGMLMGCSAGVTVGAAMEHRRKSRNKQE